MNAKRLDAVFAFLIAATGVTWFVGESASAGPAAVALILGLAGVKGWLVTREFMMLRHASAAWNLIVGGWLAFVLAMIATTYWK
ncbi:partial cytochrome c oxidase subunit IV, partial [Rhodocyclaceae bacterium]